MLSFNDLRFRYEPYPIGIAKRVFSESLYRELAGNFPPIELFKYMPHLGKKYSLSQLNHPDKYKQFISSHPRWKEFHSWIKSRSFTNDLIELLVKHGIDLGLIDRPNRSILSRFNRGLSNLRAGKIFEPRLSTRFEFSMLPASGGVMLPHTDARQKLITLIFSMIKDGEWDQSFGGGTDVLRPKDPRKYFNEMNNYLSYEDVEVLTTMDFEPNQCVIFIKTFNSWHGVKPMSGKDGSPMRKTLTLNIERLQ